MIKEKSKKLFLFIFVLFLLSLVIDLPKQFPIKLNFWKIKIDTLISSPQINIDWKGFKFKRDLDIKKGLDLQGGTHLILEADMEKIESVSRKQALDSAKEIVSRRIDLWGVSEPIIQTVETDSNYRIIVELPGISNINEAIDLIGKTAQLDFRELLGEEPEATISSTSIFDFISTGLTGKDLQKSDVQFNDQTGEPVVALHFNSEGAQKFAEITQRNVGKRVAIFLDNMPLTAPVVNEPIVNGDAIISGDFTVKEAKNLTIQLNAGALPVPLKIIEQKTIGPTLGQEAVKKSIQAGLIGLLIIILFMIAIYGFAGFLADIGLIFYGLLTLALYKLIPVTLTLPGIAGFILSVGMAVDSNILVFERMKEELRMGKPFSAAMELGFGRAWDSIKDANICTLITCFILFNPFNWGFLNASGMIRGFALTLGLGIGVSLFTGIIVTRTLLRLFYREKNK